MQAPEARIACSAGSRFAYQANGSAGLLISLSVLEPVPSTDRHRSGAAGRASERLSCVFHRLARVQGAACRIPGGRLIPFGLVKFVESDASVAEYKLYYLDGFNRIQGRADLEAEDHDAAIAEAAKRSDGRPMELWCGAEVVRRFPRSARD